MVIAWFQILSQHLLKLTEENHKITRSGEQVSIWDMNQESSDHKSVVLNSWLQHFAAKQLYSKVANIEWSCMKI